MRTTLTRPVYPTALAVFASVLLLGLFAQTARLAAQDQTQGASPSAPAASSPTDTNSTTLFPPGTGTPAPELEENRAGNRGHNGGNSGHGRHGLGGGQGGRANDLLSARAAADPVEVRIAFRKAKTVALLQHPELNVLERQAAAAPTDDEKRNDLRAYYTQLYSAVLKIDRSPSMAAHVEILGEIAEQRYDPKRRVVGGDEDLVRGGGGRKRR